MGIDPITASLIFSGGSTLYNIIDKGNVAHQNQQTKDRYKAAYLKVQRGQSLTYEEKAEFPDLVALDKQMTDQGNAKADYDRAMKELETFDLSGELEQYEKDLMGSYMKTINPALKNWAASKGLSGGTAEQDLFAKLVTSAAEKASLGKYALQQQFFEQKSNIADLYKGAYLGGTKMPSSLIDSAMKNLREGMTAGKSDDIFSIGMSTFADIFSNKDNPWTKLIFGDGVPKPGSGMDLNKTNSSKSAPMPGGFNVDKMFEGG